MRTTPPAWSPARMTLWILTVTADGDITTTTHPSVDAALACFSDNFDPEREFPRTLTGMRAAADAAM